MFCRTTSTLDTFYLIRHGNRNHWSTSCTMRAVKQETSPCHVVRHVVTETELTRAALRQSATWRRHLVLLDVGLLWKASNTSTESPAPHLRQLKCHDTVISGTVDDETRRLTAWRHWAVRVRHVHQLDARYHTGNHCSSTNAALHVITCRYVLDKTSCSGCDTVDYHIPASSKLVVAKPGCGCPAWQRRH